VNSLPKTVTRQRRDCALNPGPTAPESSALANRLPSHSIWTVVFFKAALKSFCLIQAKFHYTGPTGPDRTRTDFFARPGPQTRVSDKVHGLCLVGSGRARVVEFSYNIGTCEVSKFYSNSNRPFRFDSTVMGRFKNFRIGRVCPLLVVVRRLKPLTALSGTVYRFASSMGDYTPVLFNVFEPLRIGIRNL